MNDKLTLEELNEYEQSIYMYEDDDWSKVDNKDMHELIRVYRLYLEGEFNDKL